jgi:hypothetical protein
MAASPTHDSDPGFYPADPSDDRKHYDWESRWPKNARKRIRVEAGYLSLLLALCAIAIFLVWDGHIVIWLKLKSDQYGTFERYSYAGLGGLLGGTLFAMKWLYHTVAKGLWNADRLLWRLFSPLISSGLSFAVIALALAGIFPLVDVHSLERPAADLGVAFLVGYFSDNTIAAMARLARKVFGDHASDGSS